MTSQPGSSWRWLTARLQDFAFRPTSPEQLGAARAAYCLLTFLFYLPTDFSPWGAVDPRLWRPLPVFEWLQLPQASPTVLVVLQVAWKLALLAAAVGWHTRVAAGLASALAFYLLGLTNCFGVIGHDRAIVGVILFILAASRSGDAFSLDCWLRRGRGFSAPTASGEYTWPVRAVWLLLAHLYFSAGVAKLSLGGWEWVFSDNLAYLLQRVHYYPANAPPWTDWGLEAARRLWLTRALAGATVLLELGYPLALVSVRARWALIPAALAMHLGVRAILGPTFETLVIAHLFWIPWARWTALGTNARRQGRRRSSEGAN